MPTRTNLFFYLFSTIFLISCSTETETETQEERPAEIIQEHSSSVSDFTPREVDLGDIITIKGENFSREIQLLINEMPLSVTFNNDSIIKFKVPYSNFNPFNFKLILNDSIAESKVFENPFKLYEPKIDSISRGIGFGDKAVLYGSHLTNSPNKTRDIVFINNEMVQVEFQSKDSIVFNLPYLNTYENDILVQAQLQEIRKEKGLKIAPPVIDSISKNRIKIGETLEIYGKHFLQWSTTENKVYIEGSRAEIIEASKDKITIKIPMGPYENRNISNIEVKIYTEQTSLESNLYLEDKWYLHDVLKKSEITDSGYPGVISASSFQEGNHFYINSYMKKENDNYMNDRLLQYDPQTRELLNLPDINLTFDNSTGHNLQLFSAGNNQEIFIYLSREEDNFYRYNYLSGNLESLAEFPGPHISEATGAVLDHNFYFGLGHTGNGSVVVNTEFWEYDIANNNWSLHSEMPFESNNAYNSRKTDFVWNNSLYTGNGSDWQYDFWKFTPSEGWIKQQSVPNPLSSYAFFQLQDRAFYYHQYDNEFWEYNQVENKWINRQDLAIGQYRFIPESAFVIGDDAYMIGYYNDYGYGESPAMRYDILILKTEISNL